MTGRERVLHAVLDAMVEGDPRVAVDAAAGAVDADPTWAGALHAFALAMSQRYGDAARAADAALAAARPDDPLGVALARATCALATAGVDDRAPGDPDPLLDLAADLPGDAGDPAAFVRYLAAEAALACARLDLAADLVARSGPPAIGHGYGAVEVVMRVRLLAFRGAIAEASAVLADLECSGPEPLRLLVEATEMLVRGNAAERAQVRALADRIEAQHPSPDSYLSSGCYLLAAFGLVAVGDVQRSARLALAAGGDADLSSYMVVDRGLGFELLVAAAGIDGDLDAADSWAARAEALRGSPIAGSTVDRLASRVALLHGRADEAVELADRAIAAARAEGRAVEAAEGEIVAARARIAASQPGEAGSRLEAMVGSTDATGFLAARRAAARELRVVGRRLRPAAGSDWTGLSERERDIALMVAEGLANREIAESLHLSEHTVRAHVSRVLAAFGAASRSRVAARVAELLPPVEAPTPTLTPRQRAVAVLIARGAGNAEIAADLDLSVKTVEKHVGEILRRWQMRSRVAVARAARSLGE